MSNPFLRIEDFAGIADGSAESFGDHVIPLRMCGIYFLFHEGHLVYVGKSIDAMTRISTHRTEKKKQFDAFAFLPLPAEALDYYEAELIHRFLPPLNKSLPAGPGWSPVMEIANIFGLTQLWAWKVVIDNNLVERNGRVRFDEFKAAYDGMERPEDDSHLTPEALPVIKRARRWHAEQDSEEGGHVH